MAKLKSRLNTFLGQRAASKIPTKEELQDLGFGSIVAQRSRKRFLNRDGSFNVARTGMNFWVSFSPYLALLNMSWSKFLAAVVIFYLLVNTLFASAYLLCGPDALAGSVGGAVDAEFARTFFFSVETFSTIGYGHISPFGVAAHILVSIESLAGLLSVALVTGLVFARFSRPTGRMIFSQQAIIAPYGGIKAFQFRIANARMNQIIELEAQVLLSRFERHEGKTVRRFHNLKLERNKVTFFPLSWTIVHPIDETSPLHGQTPETMNESEAEFLVLLTGIDETFSQTVHTRSSYRADEIVWNAKFGSIFKYPVNNELLVIDVSHIHDIEPVET